MESKIRNKSKKVLSGNPENINNLEKRKDVKTRFPKRGEHKKMRIMKKNANEIFMLQYQIKRYQAMGNGTMCQTLNGKLQKLLAKQSLVTM